MHTRDAVERPTPKSLESIEPEASCLPSSRSRAFAKRLYALRRQRALLMDAALFADPAWDILLDLVINDGIRPLSVSAACLGAHVSIATALRYLGLLIERGLVERRPDKSDRRRSYVSLTAKGLAAMEATFQQFL